jgi:serine/threonine-protein kinase
MSLTSSIPSHRFGAYTIVRKLGEGGMAEVFLASAIDERSELLPVALKIAKPVSGPGVDAAELFATEADVMALLRHPNLVELFEVGKHAGRLFLAMEYLPGGDLATLMDALAKAGRPFPPSMALQIGIDLLKGLAYVHQAESGRGTPLDLVHGDINPSNVFLSLTPGRAKLGDFGVVSSRALGGGLPDGMTAGKLCYLSPEQAQGKPPIPASDLFAVGVLMFELLFGRKPFVGRTQDEVLERICSGRFERPEGISRAAEEIFERALSKSPRTRFSSAGAFAGELLRYQLDSGLQVREEALASFVEEALEIVS